MNDHEPRAVKVDDLIIDEDTQLLREALEALEILLHVRDTLSDNDPVWVLDPAFDGGRNAITLLRDRLEAK